MNTKIRNIYIAVLSKVACSPFTFLLLVLVAVFLVGLAQLQASGAIALQIDYGVLATLLMSGGLFSGVMLMVLLFSGSDEKAEPGYSDNASEQPTTLAKTSVKAIPALSITNSDSGLPRLRDWQAPERVIPRHLVIFDLNFSACRSGVNSVQSMLMDLGERLALSCENESGLHALHADTLSLAIISEASELDMSLVKSLVGELSADFSAARFASTIGVSCRHTALDGEPQVGLRTMQLATPLCLPGGRYAYVGRDAEEFSGTAVVDGWNKTQPANDTTHRILRLVD